MVTDWDWTENDQRAAESFQGQLPERIFDAHVHLYDPGKLGDHSRNVLNSGPVATYDAWEKHVGRQVGDSRLVGGLFFAIPRLTQDHEFANRFTLEEVSGHPGSRALLLIRPGDSREDAEAMFDQWPCLTGFKCYHIYSEVRPTFEAPMHTYLPQWAWEMADRRGLAIMLHMVRHRALSDPLNQKEIREHCQRYPNAKLILAHSARGFHAPNTVNGIVSLRGLPNVWFDSSGICEAEATSAILGEFGPSRLLWASDFPISDRRGKAVTLGDTFAWINPTTLDEQNPDAPPIESWPTGLENLRAFLTACRQNHLNADDLQDVFADNALRMLGLLKEEANRTQALYQHAKTRIPGGVQLLSKRPEMFAPDQWPAYFREARGCEVWDLDRKHYYDFSLNGGGGCMLGFAHPAANDAVARRLRMGVMATPNPAEEVELADRLCAIHPWANQVRFGRTGGEAVSVAVRIARATTDRSKVAICGYHGWPDWYIAANLGDNDNLRGHLLPGLDSLGVPRELRGTTLPFTYNDREGFDALLAREGERLAAVVMEPCRNSDPEPGFLEHIRAETRKRGIQLIFDEITIGWRKLFGGAHLGYGIEPDMAVFGKSLGAGHPMAAIIGTRESMAGAHGSFISSSYWTEAIGPTAALAALAEMERINAVQLCQHAGARIQKIWREAAEQTGIPAKAGGFTCLPTLSFEHPQLHELRTLYTQEMLAEGFLAGTLIWPSIAHTDPILDTFGEAVQRVFERMAEAIAGDRIAESLRGPVAHTGFRRLI